MFSEISLPMQPWQPSCILFAQSACYRTNSVVGRTENFAVIIPVHDISCFYFRYYYTMEQIARENILQGNGQGVLG